MRESLKERELMREFERALYFIGIGQSRSFCDHKYGNIYVIYLNQIKMMKPLPRVPTIPIME